MRIVVFGPDKRLGLWEDGQIVDLNGACAKLLAERQDEPRPYAMADALVPAQLRAPVSDPYNLAAKLLERGAKLLPVLLNRSADLVRRPGRHQSSVLVAIRSLTWC